MQKMKGERNKSRVTVCYLLPRNSESPVCLAARRPAIGAKRSRTHASWIPTHFFTLFRRSALGSHQQSGAPSSRWRVPDADSPPTAMSALP